MDERVVGKTRSKVKKKQEIQIMFAGFGKVAFTSKVNLTMIILMKTMVFICRGRNAGIANVEGQTGSDRQGQTKTDRDIEGVKGKDRQRQTGT